MTCIFSTARQPTNGNIDYDSLVSGTMLFGVDFVSLPPFDKTTPIIIMQKTKNKTNARIVQSGTKNRFNLFSFFTFFPQRTVNGKLFNDTSWNYKLKALGKLHSCVYDTRRK